MFFLDFLKIAIKKSKLKNLSLRVYSKLYAKHSSERKFTVI